MKQKSPSQAGDLVAQDKIVSELNLPRIALQSFRLQLAAPRHS